MTKNKVSFWSTLPTWVKSQLRDSGIESSNELVCYYHDSFSRISELAMREMLDFAAITGVWRQRIRHYVTVEAKIGIQPPPLRSFKGEGLCISVKTTHPLVKALRAAKSPNVTFVKNDISNHTVRVTLDHSTRAILGKYLKLTKKLIKVDVELYDSHS